MLQRSKVRRLAIVYSFKNGFDQEEETHLNIRKQKKNERLWKRRFENTTEMERVPNANVSKTTSTIEDLPTLVTAIRGTSGLAEPLIDATQSIR